MFFSLLSSSSSSMATLSLMAEVLVSILSNFSSVLLDF